MSHGLCDVSAWATNGNPMTRTKANVIVAITSSESFQHHERGRRAWVIRADAIGINLCMNEAPN
jgi:hypothetical protein